MIKNRKYAIPSALILLAAALCLLLVGVKRQIHQEFTCYVSSVEDPDYSRQVTVTFDGTYIDFLLRTDRFNGFIDVSPFDLMPEVDPYIPDYPREQLDPWELPITTKTEKMGAIGYFVLDKGDTSHAIRGRLWAEEGLGSFIMSYYCYTPTDEHSGYYETIAYISYPEPLTSEEAQEIMFAGET